MSRSAGFTLVEVVLAVVLSTLIMLGLYTIFSTTFSVQKNSYKQDIVQGGTVLGVKSIQLDVEDSGTVLIPDNVTPEGDTLVGCKNYDIKLNSSIDGGPWREYMYCWDGTDLDYYYIDQANPAAPCNPAACPVGPRGPAPLSLAGWSVMRLAVGVARFNDVNICAGCAADPMCPNYKTNLFCHTTNDQISMHFAVMGSTPPYVVNTTVGMLSSVQAP